MHSQVLVPNGAGLYNDFTGQYPASGNPYEKIDDGASHDGDSTYIYHDDPDYPGQAEFVLSDAVHIGTIQSVELHCVGKRVDAPYGNSVEAILVVDGTEYVDGSYSLGTSYADHSQTFLVNPKTSVAWSWADIDALKARIYVEITTSGELWFTSLYVIVNHTIPSSGGAQIIGLGL